MSQTRRSESMDTIKKSEMRRLYYKLTVPHSRSKRCFLTYLFIIPLYLVIGGFTFSMTEMDASEKAVKKNAQLCVAERKALMKNLRLSLANDFFPNFSEFDNFTDMWRSIHTTVIKIENCHRKELLRRVPKELFVFKNGLLYSFGVYTTIGYGNLFPRTISGRILTVAYAIIGIPLNIAFIADFGELIARAIHRSLRYFRHYILKRPADNLWIEYKKFGMMILLAIVSTPALSLVVMVHIRVERSRNWSYLDSLYYTFTTSALIGLGDFVPRPSNVQFFILMPLFLIAETILALMVSFITHLYRFETVILFQIIKLKISGYLVHRRLKNVQSTRQQITESARMLQDSDKEQNGTSQSVADYDAEIAKLSAREQNIQKRISTEMEMLEAVPSQLDLRLMNTRITRSKRERRLMSKLKNWLRI